jgi:hypothetical protein
MKKVVWILGLVICGLLLLPPIVAAQNTTYSSAIPIGSAGNRAQMSLTTAAEQHWYWFDVTQYRSYCAEALASDQAFTNVLADTYTSVYRMDGTTLIGSNDDSGEPSLGFGSRVCFINTTTDYYNYVMVRPYTTPSSTWYAMARIVETTQFCNWFYLGGDYNAFVMLKNTTNATISVRVMWKNPAGTTVATLSTSIAAYGTGFYLTKDYVNPATTPYGSIEVSHNGGVGAIEGSVTTLSGTTGIGFDAQFTPRRLY